MSDENSPVHTISGPGTRWSRANFSEAIQGVQTPLGWTFWDRCVEATGRRAFGAIGALSSPVPDDPDLRFSAAFYGLPAGNVDTFHTVGEALPGTTGDQLVEQMFGEPPRTLSEPSRSWRTRLRVSVVAARTPVAAVRAGRRLPTMREEYRQWWRANVLDQPPATMEGATDLLREAARRYIEIGTPHALITMVGQALAGQVELLAEKAWGDRSGAADLMTGYGALEETSLIADIWAVAQDELTFDALLGRHGYHGPDEGNLCSQPWRDDPTSAHRMISLYKSSEVAHPRAREAEQAQHRADAERRLMGSLSRADRTRARAVLRLTRATIPMRELGKAGFLHAVDGARCAARLLGGHLVDRGFLDDAEDVFFLTYNELTAGVDGPRQGVVAERRADHRRFESTALPPAWTGNPVATLTTADDADLVRAEPTDAGLELTGIGIFGGRITGRARVVVDPHDADLEPGDVLVCRTTDPSWTPLFLVAGALVIDTGGSMSHGAIVARELGVTCVINTVTGTRDISDGAVLVVNGQTGTVRLADG